MRWYQSLVFKNNFATFVATHVPLLGLIGLMVGWPDLLSPWTVFWTALTCTLLATAAVVFTQWHLFRPLRAAADGLKGYMIRGTPFRAVPGTSDEVGRLLTVLVRSLSHLDRGRTPLLGTGAMVVGEASAELEVLEGAHSWLGLVEIDDSELLDVQGDIARLKSVQRAMETAAEACVDLGEMALPWGRARMLLLLKGSANTVRSRVEAMCGRIKTADGETFTASAALVPEGDIERSRAAALQRLEQKIFALRLDGKRSSVV